MTVRQTQNRPGAGDTRAIRQATETAPDPSRVRPFRAMIDVHRLHRVTAGWVGALMRTPRDDARAAFQHVRPADLEHPALVVTAHAVWHAINDGDAPEWRAVADAAYRHRLVHTDDHAVFVAFLIDLMNLRPVPRGVLEAATTPAPMARFLADRAAQGVR